MIAYFPEEWMVYNTIRKSEVCTLCGYNQFILGRPSEAKRLYASEGFISFAREERGLKVGDSYFDEEQMALRLFQQ